MTSDNFDKKPSYAQLLSSVFEWMPAAALVIDTNGIIQEVNLQAIHFFRATTKEDFIFDKQNIRNMVIDTNRAVELIRQISKSSEPINVEILIRRFDKSISCVDLYACHFPGDTNYIFLQFTDMKPQNQVYVYELSHAFKREAQRLRPYLNKPGKNILEEILIEDIVESIVSNKITKKTQIVVVGEDRINKLKVMFPEFSNNELIFCGYLSLGMSVEEISTIIDKTPNTLRVSFHRILQKTTFSTGKDFLRALEAL